MAPKKKGRAEAGDVHENGPSLQCTTERAAWQLGGDAVVPLQPLCHSPQHLDSCQGDNHCVFLAL